MKQVVILPVGGSATRMLGLPKFLLPASRESTLIELHCEAALLAGYDSVIVVTSPQYVFYLKV